MKFGNVWKLRQKQKRTPSVVKDKRRLSGLFFSYGDFPSAVGFSLSFRDFPYNFKKHFFIVKILPTFASGWFRSTHFLDFYRSVMLNSCWWKPRKFSISKQDASIVVPTLYAWAAIPISVCAGFPRTFIWRRGIAVPRFFCIFKGLFETGRHVNFLWDSVVF